MGPWHCLSGVLHSKPTGAFSRFKSKRAHYYVFEESRCQLHFHRDQSDALQRDRTPLGTINVKGAAITLKIEEPNTFVIHSEGRDFSLQAENHESMMIWVLALQANRDAFASKDLRPAEQAGRLTAEQQIAMAHKRRESAPDVSFGAAAMLARPWCADRRSSKINVLDASALMSRSAIEEEEDGYLGSLGNNRKLQDSMNNRLGLSTSQSFSVLKSASPRRRGSAFPSISAGGDTAGSQELQVDFNYDSLMDEATSPRRQAVVTFGIQLPPADDARRPSGSSCCGHSDAACSPRSSASSRRADTGEQSTTKDLDDLRQENAILREVLRKRDSQLAELDLKLSRLEQLESAVQLAEDTGARKAKVSDGDWQQQQQQKFKTEGAMLDLLETKTSEAKHLEEQCRVLQNNNKFLNNEVKKITRWRLMEQEKFRSQDRTYRDQKLQLENWKRDYLFLLQSCVTVPTGDLADGFRLNAYGGARHASRLRELLEEARGVNPRLPTFEGLEAADGHVDSYGFRHCGEVESVRLHYICCQLHEHYCSMLERSDEHQKHWRAFVTSSRPFTKTSELKSLVRAGIPRVYRCAVWRELIHTQVQEVRAVKGQQYYNSLVQRIPESETAAVHRKQVTLDLLRTMPNNVKFETEDSEGIQKLQEILQAFCIHNPNVGYCQGMNFIAAMGLLFLSKEDAFWLLVAVTETYFHPLYFTGNLIGAQADQLVLKELIKSLLPKLYDHLLSLDIDMATVTLNWFLALFFDSVPFDTLLRVWDCFLLEGPKVLFRFSLAILQLHEAALLQQTDTISLWRHLKAVARLTFDVDGLARATFNIGKETDQTAVKKMPSRQEIAARQNFFISSLVELEDERHRRRQDVFDETDMEREVDTTDESPNDPLTCCGCSSSEGSVWICYGDSDRTRMCRLSADQNLMYNMGNEVDSRVTCMCQLGDESGAIAVGTMGMTVLAFDGDNGELLWERHLPDSILDLLCTRCQATETGGGSHATGVRLFAALASGSLAVLEGAAPDSPVFFISLGSRPVTALALAPEPLQLLWAAAGASLRLLHPDTLDAVRGASAGIQVSEDPFAVVRCLRACPQGIWVVVRGSAVVQLWSADGTACRLRFNVLTLTQQPKTERRPSGDGVGGSARVTSLLTVGGCGDSGQLWVGTACGELAVFGIREGAGEGEDEGEDKGEGESDCADGGGDFRLELTARNKVAESAIVCLVPVGNGEQNGEGDATCIVSCSRRFAEDESVLRWRRESGDQQIWTNEPVFEVNPATRTVLLPTYMVVRNRIGSDRTWRPERLERSANLSD